MSKLQYNYLKTYDSTFKKLGIPYAVDIYNKAILPLEREGYSESGICYAINRAEEKLLKFYGDTRFYSILQNEVRKIAYKRNDPRWENKSKIKYL